MIVKNYWHFIKTKLIFSASSATLTVHFIVISDNFVLSDTLDSSAALATGRPYEFNRLRMQVIFGNNPIIGMFPTCTIVRYVSNKMKIRNYT